MIEKGTWRALNCEQKHARHARETQPARSVGSLGWGTFPSTSRVQHCTVVEWVAGELGAVGEAPVDSKWS